MYIRYLQVSVIFFLSIAISGCRIDKFSVTLMLDNEIYQEWTLEDEELLNLPEVDKQLYVFVGWSDGEKIYYDEYQATKSVTLTATFELISDVFQYDILSDSETQSVGIKGYTGSALYLKVPAYIDDMVVISLLPASFANSNIIEIYLPMEVVLQPNVFQNSTSLKSITYYGEYLIPYQTSLSQEQYDDILNENSVNCTIISGSEEEGQYSFSPGCPIIEITEKKSINVVGQTYTLYVASMDKNLYFTNNHVSYYEWSINDTPNLTTIEIPTNSFIVSPLVFRGAPSLSTIIVHDNNTRYTVIDGVLYSKDGSSLIFYPPGLDGDSFSIPDNVTSVQLYAFYKNQSLKTLTIPENYSNPLVLDGLERLEEFVVDPRNTVYHSSDGVLYRDNELVKYPANKAGNQFELASGITSIGPYGFSSNQNLSNINLGNELTVINPFAFAFSENIRLLTIPSSVEIIHNYIFSESNIETIIVYRDKVLDNSITNLILSFGPVEMSNFAIYVPDSSFDDYQQDNYWKTYSSVIHRYSEYPTE